MIANNRFSLMWSAGMTIDTSARFGHSHTSVTLDHLSHMIQELAFNDYDVHRISLDGTTITSALTSDRISHDRNLEINGDEMGV